LILDSNINLVMNILSLINIEDTESFIVKDDSILNCEHMEKMITSGLLIISIEQSCHHSNFLLISKDIIIIETSRRFIFSIY
jgi:hypothetical protein